MGGFFFASGCRSVIMVDNGYKPTGVMMYTNEGRAREVRGATDKDDAKSLVEKWKKNKANCPKCESKMKDERNVTDGCRMNGDAYGRYIYECSNKECDWSYHQVWD